jgi:glucose-1-phosphate thymidylyltransferase
MNIEHIGLVPAAGKGVRLGLPYPKELYPVIRNNRYKPVAQFILDNLIDAGLNHVVFVVTESKHQLIGYFGNGRRFGCNISYVVQEPPDNSDPTASPGLAHALDSAYHLTRHKVVHFGMADTVMQPTDVFASAYSSLRPGEAAALALFETHRPEKFGMVRYTPNYLVEEIVDKPQTTDLSYMWGCIVWQPVFTEHLHECVAAGLTDFAQVLNSAIAQGMSIRAVPTEGGAYLDLGTYDEILEMDSLLSKLAADRACVR